MSRPQDYCIYPSVFDCLLRSLKMLSQRWPHFLFRLSAAVAAVSLLLTGSCSPAGKQVEAGSVKNPDAAGGATALVSEAWGHIQSSYANWDRIDLEQVQGEALTNLLELTETPPYPFLSEVGRMRGQPPVGTPPELVDLWRGLALHQAEYPEVAPRDRTRAVIAGMVAGLGEPSGVVIPAENYPETKNVLQEALQGSYVGIGAQISRSGGQISLAPFEDSPAERAGIRVGDALVAIEGKPVTGRSLEEMVELISGAVGSKVRLSVRRLGDADLRIIDVFRGDIDLESVRRQLAPGGIGYIQVEQFRHNTGGQFLEALEDLDRFDMLALILDLRSNPGGSMEAAGQMAEHFLGQGTVFVSTEDRSAGDYLDRVDYVVELASPRRLLENVPVVVLINGQTMGEAEALAGALQDTQRASLLGTASFGKGSGNQFIELTDGSAIYLPTSRWYGPSGELIGSGGIQPDVVVPFEEETTGYSRDSQFNRAYQLLNDLLPPFR